MKLVWFYVFFVSYVESSDLAVMKLKSSKLNTDRLIYFDDEEFYKFYDCLANNMTQTCTLSLKHEGNENYKITNIAQKSLDTRFLDTGFSSLIPLYSCSFPKSLIQWDPITCYRNTKETTIHNFNLSLYAFALTFRHDDEYIFKDSLKNISIGTKIFAYSLSQDMLNTSTTSVNVTDISSVTDVTSTLIPTTLRITDTTIESNDSTVNTTNEADMVMSTDNNAVSDIEDNSRVFSSIIIVSVLVSVLVIVLVTVYILRFFKRKKKQSMGMSAKMNAQNHSVRNNNSSIREVTMNSDELELVYSRPCENMEALANENGDLLPGDYSIASASAIEVNHSLQEVTYHNGKVTEPSKDNTNCSSIYSKLHENKIMLANEYGDLQSEDNKTKTLTNNHLSSSPSNKSHHKTVEMISDSKEVEEFPNSTDCEKAYSNEQENLKDKLNAYEDLSAEYSNAVSISGYCHT